MAKSNEAQRPSIVELFSQANEADLVDIDSRIAVLEEQRAGIDKQIDSLRTVRRVIDVKLNGKPARVQRQQRKNKTTAVGRPAAQEQDDGSDDLFDRIKVYLEHAGETSAPKLAAELGVSVPTVQKRLNRGQEMKVFARGLRGWCVRPGTRDDDDED
ncbi:MAG TPA: hypothetical protein VG713_13020 [Pirellulales bacterium]|nr:hypothetical protein [Pirellulales bacterium]